MHSKSDYKRGDGWIQRVDALCDMVRFSDFDIFGAQEVCHDQLLDMQARMPDYAYTGVARDDGKTKGEYSPVFYKRNRFKLLDSGTFWLSETPESVSKGWDGQCRRVCSWGYFKDRESGVRFWFFNTHMDHRGVVARREGAKLISKRIAEMCGKGETVILTGDFNVPQDSEPYLQILSDGRLVDAYESAEVCYAPTGTFNSFKVANHTTKRIDHVFVSKGVKVERYGILTYHYWSDETGEKSSLTDAPHEISANKKSVHLHSDHYPVSVWLQLKKN
jgi:endonuclease/exonuclease/phosphatase family metal-dependent hydrolase